MHDALIMWSFTRRHAAARGDATARACLLYQVCVSMRGASEGALKLQFVAEEKKAAPRPHAYDKKYLPEGHTV